mgnify:CR=1 FL=1
MKILWFGQTDPYGISVSYSNLINHYTKDECRLVTFNESMGYDSDISFNRELFGAFNMRPPEYFHQEFARLIDWCDTVIINMGVSPGTENSEFKYDDSDFRINDVPFHVIVKEQQKKVFAFFLGSPSLRGNYQFYNKICRLRQWPIITCQTDIYRTISQNNKCKYIPILLDDSNPRYHNSIFDFSSNKTFNFGTISISHIPMYKNTDGKEKIFLSCDLARRSLGADSVKEFIIEYCSYIDSLCFKKQSFIGLDNTDGYYSINSIENMLLGLINLVYLDQYAIDLISNDIGEPPPWEIIKSPEEMSEVYLKYFKNKNNLYDNMKSSYDFARYQWSGKNNIHKLVEALGV